LEIQESAMSVRTLFILFNLVMFAVVVVGAKAQDTGGKREVSAEVRSKLFKQVMSDMDEFRECVQQAEGGPSAAQENTYIEEVELNRDGVKEYHVPDR
jgi:hypothetical protein